MKFKIWWCLGFLLGVDAIPVGLLYDFNVREARQLPKEDDVSSEEIQLKVPIVFYGQQFDTIFVNSNGFLSFQTDIPQFINIEFPLAYPIIAPLYSNVDIRPAGSISYYETDSAGLLQRATENIHDAFLNAGNFQATSLFIATWQGVGYHDQGADKVNTFQVVIASDGAESYVEFLYPENGIQWIQGTGDLSGLPDARAQVGLLFEGKMFTLPGSGTEQVRNLERWSNMGLAGQFIFRIDKPEIVEPDTNNAGSIVSKNAGTCSENPTACHVQARCSDYDAGFCCECNEKYYGNGKFCVKKDLPLRVNGKVSGNINGEKFENLDLQSYIVMGDGRAYTAVSKVPESIGEDIQSLQILGGVIGYLFAKPVRDALNGYQLTGGVFNHTATIVFLNTSQTLRVQQRYLGLDVFDQLRLEADVIGDIPTLSTDSRVDIDEYQELYTQTAPGIIQMTSQKSFRSANPDGSEVVHHYSVEQTFVFDNCKFENGTVGQTWRLKVGKNFISYESREQIIRFGLSNKISPLGDVDPCEEGRSRCTPNSACVVENDSYRCVCNPGYQQFYTGTETVCADVNECQAGQYECDYNAQCVNVIGSYTCVCNPGFEGDGRICENARSCSNITCNENAECMENSGIATCKCLPGFSGDGTFCSPIVDHSCHVANNCSPYGYCSINPETNNYYCACLPGFEGDGYRCTPLPPTTTTDLPTYYTEPDRIPEAVQTESVPPYSDGYRIRESCVLGACWCPSGYEHERGSSYCIPTQVQYTTPYETTNNDEELETPEVQCYNATMCFCPKGFYYKDNRNTCMLLKSGNDNRKGFSGQKNTCNILNNCNRNAQCVYIDDSYQCQCITGYEGDGYSCESEQVSCTTLDNCDPHATCTYDETLGKSRCICNPGYEGDGLTCSATASCSSNQDCASTEDCVYTSSQRYECVCKDGYVRDSQHFCVPVTGSCGGGQCVENAECLYDDEYQTFYCTCKSGYIGDGITECKLKPVGCDTLNNCGLHATCMYEEQALTYVCRCNPGFFGDGFICAVERNCHVDPSMCDKNAVCLTDAERRYICQCHSGYVGDGTSCREIVRQEGNFLLVNQGIATLKIPMEPSRHNTGRPIQIQVYQTAVGLDIDCVEGRVYWSDVSGRAIRSSLYNGSSKADFINTAIGSPEGLAIDWVSRNIYWTDSTNDTIEVANLDTKRRRTLFYTDLVNPRGIAVHPQRGKIFWTDWDRKHPKIEWANADGSDRQIFMEGESVSLPNSLAIDYDTEQLCYADAGTKKIECIQIDTKQKQTIAVNCTYPFGIAITEKHIYWSDWILKKIERVDKYSLTRLTPLPVPLGGSGNKLFGLVAVPNHCPSLTNVCQYSRNRCPAEHICLPDGLGGKSCLCSYRSDNLSDRPSCVL